MTVKIVHIADVHWRGLSRHKEYRETFETFYEECRKLQPDYIYIGGDIVHSKTQNISPELIHELSVWFNEMAKIARVVVILGNHDGLMLNLDRMDAVSPIVDALNNPNITLYKDSGVFQFQDHPGYNWCVLSCFDEDNWKNVAPIENDINIALYHGAIWGSYTDIGFKLEGEDDMSLFDAYDFAMLGDIHKRQCLDKDGKIWYSGSVIPQNFSEIQQKGFLYWEINSKDDFSVGFVPIAHVNPHVTIEWHGDLQTLIDDMGVIKDGSKIRVRSDERLPYTTARSISKKIRKTFKVSDVVFKYKPSFVNVSSEMKEIIKGDVLESGKIKKLLREYNNKERDDSFWVSVDTEIANVMASSPDLSQSNNRWSIKKMEFDNTFGYGPENIIDFSKLNGIVGVFGRNRQGKSSIPGSIAYGLFNKNDRGLASNLHIINVRSNSCQVNVTFESDSKLYRAERFSSKGTSRGSETAVTYLNLLEVDGEGNTIKDLSGEQRRETEKYLADIIGTPSDFLLTSFASQGAMNNFIDLGASERRKTICRFLGLDIFSEMNKLFKERSLTTKVEIRKYENNNYEELISSTNEKITGMLSNLDSTEELISDLDIILEADISILKEMETHIVKDIEPVNVLKNKIDKIKIMISKNDSKVAEYNKKADAGVGIVQTISEFLNKEKYNLHEAEVKNIDLLKKASKDLNDTLQSIKRNYSHKSEIAGLLKEVPCGDEYLTCKFISNSHKASKELGTIKTNLEKTKTSLDDINTNIDEQAYKKAKLYISDFNAKKVKLAEFQLKLSKMQLEKERLINISTSSKGDLIKLENKLVLSEKASDPALARKIIEAEDEILFNKRKSRELHNTLLSVSTDIGIHREKLKNYISDWKKYKELLKSWSLYDFLISATNWKGIPAIILNSMVPAINDELGSILQDCVGFTIELEIDDAKTEIYINYGDSRRPIGCGSGMEKMVSSLALRVALTNISSLNKSDMLIIDEGFGALDSVNIESVMQLLQKLKNWYRLILLISHVDVVKDCVDDIIEITSEGKNSKVVAV